MCGDYLPWSVPLWSWGIFLGLTGSLLIVAYCRRWYGGYGAALFFFLAGVGCCLAGRQRELIDYPFVGRASLYQVVLQEEPQERERSMRCLARLASEQQDGQVQAVPPFRFQLYFLKDSTVAALHREDVLWIYARLSPPVDWDLADGFDYVRYLHRRGIAGTAYVADGRWQRVGHEQHHSFQGLALDYRDRIVALYRRLGFQGDELAVLSALTVGDKSELDATLRTTYSATGAAHVLALSGLHVGILYLLLWTLLAPLWRWKGMRPLLVVCLLIALWGFAFLTGLSASVVRAVTVCSMLLLSRLQLQWMQPMNTLAATAFLMLLFRPMWIFDVGFQLSFAAVVAILLFHPWLMDLCPSDRRWIRKVWGVAALSTAAQLGTAPLVLYYFSNFPIHFLLTNLWVVPWVSLILYASLLMLALTPLPLWQQCFSVVVETQIRLQNEWLQWIERLPGATLGHLRMTIFEVLLCYLFLFQLLYWRQLYTARRTMMLLFILLLLLLCHTAFNHL